MAKYVILRDSNAPTRRRETGGMTAMGFEALSIPPQTWSPSPAPCPPA